MRRIKWGVKQVLPLHYCTAVRNVQSNQAQFVTWRMWLGRSFNVRRISV
ncbi:MAG TPA: hypothetical protein VH234_05680 [Candidatus Saccharimonadales bacterium]|nr:hypothetical protein [Candidatus Saccharimonadales bacterium]